MMIKIGRGVGAGLIIDGRLFGGDDFGAGEIGHVSIDPAASLPRVVNTDVFLSST